MTQGTNKRDPEVVTDIDGLGQDWTYDDEATKAMETAGEEEEDGTDAYMTYLQQEHHKYRMLTFIMAILGVTAGMLAIGLSTSGIIDLSIYNIFMTLTYLFIFLTVIFGFTRVRPFKKQMKKYAAEKEAQKEPDPDEPEKEVVDGITFVKHSYEDMDNFYKIFERKARTELIPPGEEYARLRKTWLAVFAAAAVIGLAAIVIYALKPEFAIGASIALIIAFILVIVGFYIDRTKMKPMRNEYARQFRMTEFQMRDNMSRHKTKTNSDEKSHS